MSMEEILARPRRTFPRSDRFLHLLQLDPHVVDVRVDGDQVDVLFLQQQRITLCNLFNVQVYS